MKLNITEPPWGLEVERGGGCEIEKGTVFGRAKGPAAVLVRPGIRGGRLLVRGGVRPDQVMAR